MSLEGRARSRSLAWSNPLAWWWGLLTLVSGANIAAWFLLYRRFHEQPIGSLGSTSGTELMLLLCAAYVFGCAFRSFLPRADVQRICLFDTWLSSVVVGRSVATVAEICFSAQWAIILQNYLGNAIENSIWAVAFLVVGVGLCRLLPEFNGPVRVVLAIAISGIVAYLAFLMTIDVPMYLGRWQADLADGSKPLGALEGLHDARTRWVVTHDFAQWKGEIAWMSLYFSAAVWASLALCVFYSLGDHLPRYRTEAAAVYAPAFAGATRLIERGDLTSSA